VKDTTISVDVAKSVFEIAVSVRPGHVAETHRLSRPRFAPFFAAWNCPDLTHTKFSWQACQQEVCGGEEATTLRSGVQG
jgi:hypothetical protein